ELSAAELRRVRRQIAESPEFCELLMSDKRLADLAELALAAPGDDDSAGVESSNSKAGRSGSSSWRGGSRGPWIITIGAVVLGLLLGGLLVQIWRGNKDGEHDVGKGGPIAQRDDKKPADGQDGDSQTSSGEKSETANGAGTDASKSGSAKNDSANGNPAKLDAAPGAATGDSATKPADKAEQGVAPGAAAAASDKGAEKPTEQGLAKSGEKEPTKADVPVAPKPAPPMENPPWHEVVHAAGDPPAWSDVCFDSFDTTKSLPTRDYLAKWFDPVVGHGLRWSEYRTEYGPCGTFEGLARLKAPFGGDLALRMALDAYPRLQIHLYAGERGVSLVYHQDAQFRWTAYATTRAGEIQTPKTWSLLSSDAGRCRRTEIRFGGPLELRHRDGQVILSRGDIVLLVAPMEQPPDTVLFGGKATFHGITLVKTKDGPPVKIGWPEDDGAVPAARTDIAARADRGEASQPATWQWAEKLPDSARLERRPEGGVRLVVDEAKARGWAAAPLPKVGLQEIIIKVDKASPGTSLFLSKDGQPSGRFLRFVSEKRNGGLGLLWSYDDEKREDTWPVVPERAANMTSDSPWLKFIIGCGLIRTWKSEDGDRWVELQPPVKLPTTDTTHLGLHHVASPTGSQIGLSEVRFRSLVELPQLADPQLVSRLPDLRAAKDLASWNELVAKGRPQDVDESAWRRSAAVSTLARGGDATFGPPLVELLLDAAATLRWTLDRQLRLLNEGALLLDVYESPPIAVAVANRYHQLGQAAFEVDESPPWSSVRGAFMSSPLETIHVVPLFPPAAIRTELLQLLYSGQWAEAVEFCRRLRFYQQHQQMLLIEWGETMARRATPGRDKAVVQKLPRPRSEYLFRVGPPRSSRRDRSSLARLKAQWAHPLQEDLSKDAYNAFAELEALLASDAHDDAARLVAALNPQLVTGLAPLNADEELLASLPAAVEWFEKSYEPLRTAMNERFAKVAPLRVRQALQTGEPAAVELVAQQFAGTEAAAEAHQWLGDRALSGGSLLAAHAAYRRAQASASSGSRAGIEARLRLVAALLGRDEGKAPGVAVQFGGVQVAPQEFETLVADARRQGGQGSLATPLAALDRNGPLSPKPGQYETVVRGMLDGATGEQPQDEVVRNLTKLKVDWAGRQIGWTLDGSTLLVNNRFQIAAYDLAADGKRLWQTTPPAGKRMLRAREWPMVAMTPVASGKFIFARQLYGDGPVLGCWDRATGQNVWLADHWKIGSVASDPWLIQDRLLVLVVTRVENQESLLRLATVDPDTGDLASITELARLSGVWHSRHVAETTLVDDLLVTNLGGAVLACDLAGRVRWLRKQVVLPPEEETEWVLQDIQRPIVSGGKLLVAQPGVRCVDCIDVESGGLVWRRFLPDVRRIIGVSDGRAIVVTDAGVLAVAMD
ncbi:MAG TPA: PQQ-binding-like beta-propeller repeat protein, partial [Pirellulaceae bacterium]|nr:PQQ-binding-like beta-propeller repeat protein [Pirellulaceae bacterium]